MPPTSQLERAQDAHSYQHTLVSIIIIVRFVNLCSTPSTVLSGGENLTVRTSP